MPTKIAKELTVLIRVTSRNREQMRQMILRGPDVHPVSITLFVVATIAVFESINAVVSSMPDSVATTPNAVKKPRFVRTCTSACPPEFLAWTCNQAWIYVNPDGSQDTSYVVDDAATLANLHGEDLDGQKLAEDDPRAKLHYRWMHELAQADKVHPASTPWKSEIKLALTVAALVDEWGDRTRVEDRLSTIDRNGNPKPGLLVERHLIDGDVAIFNRQPHCTACQ